LSLPLPHFRFSLFVISETFATKVVLTGPNTWKSEGAKPGCKADVEEVPTAVLEFSPGSLGLYGIWYCHDEAVPLLLVDLDVFCELHPKASTELYSRM
jgi:hypothetical protein